MTTHSPDVLEQVKAHLGAIRALIPEKSHVLLTWGEKVKDIHDGKKIADLFNSSSNPCQICQGHIYYA